VTRSPAWTRGRTRRGAWTARVAMGGGERGGKGKRERRGDRRFLKRRRGRQRRGGGPRFDAAWRGKRRRGPGFDDMDRHGTNAMAPGCSNSGGRACLAGAGCEQGRTAACVTRNGAADRWGRATLGPGGSGWGAGGSANELGSTARCADRWARQHSAARFGFEPIQTGSNRFKFGETLTDPKGVFPCLKNWK
jgi:hypothetical protein